MKKGQKTQCEAQTTHLDWPSGPRRADLIRWPRLGLIAPAVPLAKAVNSAGREVEGRPAPRAAVVTSAGTLTSMRRDKMATYMLTASG